jgi:hypothetical protein
VAAGVFGFGTPGEMGGVGPAGVRVSPGYQPTPNSEPMGSITGVPVRTRLYSFPLLAGASVQIISGTRENKIVLITPPDVGFTVYVGEAGVTPQTGFALQPGTEKEIILAGFQEIYAVSDAPVTLRLQIEVAPILLAERERRL